MAGRLFGKLGTAVVVRCLPDVELTDKLTLLAFIKSPVVG